MKNLKPGDIMEVTSLFNLASGLKLTPGRRFCVVEREQWGMGDYPSIYYTLRAQDDTGYSFTMIDVIVRLMEKIDGRS